jgi:hypothetical protein
MFFAMCWCCTLTLAFRLFTKLGYPLGDCPCDCHEDRSMKNRVHVCEGVVDTARISFAADSSGADLASTGNRLVAASNCCRALFFVKTIATRCHTEVHALNNGQANM